MHHGVRLQFFTMESDCIFALASAKLQSDSLFPDSLFIYCSFSPNDLIKGANSFFSSCTRAV
ncbi:Uncharacterised protein [Achromobacter spanius]|nr:hypothetical protein LMG5911_04085 [Achromobacter spanius]SPT38527.1 Uncharacterised protein [Achromobacter denitrificans]VEE59649.1 Uncharacterised protein [Achromobacter spanius]